MIIRVNNDVTLGLTAGHGSRQALPQCNIIIDPHYHWTPYLRQVKQTSTERVSVDRSALYCMTGQGAPTLIPI